MARLLPLTTLSRYSDATFCLTRIWMQLFRYEPDMLPHRHERVQYIDCGAAFLIDDPARPGGRIIDARLVPDGVHPAAAGMDVLGLCLDPTVAYLKSHPHAGVRKKVVAEVGCNCRWPL